MFKAKYVSVSVGIFVFIVSVAGLAESVGSSFGVVGAAAMVQVTGGNSINGHIFDRERRPLGETHVELLDDFSRMIGRTRTDSSGRYFFSRIPAGRYKVRVMPLGSDFAEQTQEVEISNVTYRLPGGSSRTAGFENVQLDFYLRRRETGKNPGANNPAGTVFAQDVPAEARKAYEKGVTHLDEGRDETGLGELKKAIEIFPNYFAALNTLGYQYLKREQYEAARVLLTKAVEVNPKSASTFYSLGYAQYNLKQKLEAIESFRRSTSLPPSSLNAELVLGRVLREVGRYEEAETQLKRANKLVKGVVAEVHWQLALLYGNNLKRYREAADELETFLKLQPDSRDAQAIKKLIKVFRDKAAKN
ncbi:MAG TPA: tetratricopeptide repeat protein [Pyrinomonadaceae bacterium]|jgi:tetratricopeptide (TPR) repeat protein